MGDGQTVVRVGLEVRVSLVGVDVEELTVAIGCVWDTVEGWMDFAR